jgi:DNA-binding response OmpR family regulator
MVTGAKTILIVDDDPTIVQTLKGTLERHGCQTSIAMDGREALDKVNQLMPDLIILDLWLPKIPGEMVCKIIKKNEKLKKIPIIMVTGKVTDVDQVIGRVIGADYYIKKPFEVGTLLKIIQDVFEAGSPQTVPQ